MKRYRSTSGMMMLVLAGLLTTQLVSANPLPNAWQITDDSTAGGSTLSYTTNLTLAQQQSATNSGFHFTVNARLVSDFGGTKTMNLLYGLGTNRLLIWLELNGSGNLTAELEGGTTYTLTTNGTGAELYHYHEIIYTNGTASYLFDGQVKTNGWKGSATASTAGLVSWGAGSSSGQGQMNFHAVSFATTGLGEVATYDAGTNGNPAIAPDPTALGWTLNPGTSTTVTNVSPDTDLAVITLPADQFTNTSARLNGLCNPLGSPSVVWFEWGTNFSYGNVTPPQAVGAGVARVSVSNVLGGLIGGPEYHYRLVVSNASLGSVTGSDESFNISFIQTVIPGLPGVYQSAVAWGDYDNDGRLDFLISGFGTGEYFSQLWRNTGSGFTNVLIPDLPQLNYSSAAWGDFNNDSRLDFLLTGFELGSSAGVSQLWMNTGSGFVNMPIPGLPQAYQGSVAWGDYDNDGRLDFLLTGIDSVSGIRVSQIWHNLGGGVFAMANALAPDLPGVNQSAVAWGDYDNDGRPDFLFTGFVLGVGRVSQVWRNTGSGFSNVTASVALGLPGISIGSVAWGDYDIDGRLDFLLTGLSLTGPVSQLWRNTDSGFSNVTASVAPGLPGVVGSSGAWGDYDNDGRLDFFLGGQLWRNSGNGFTNVPVSGITAGSSVAWGDYDGDGRLDLLLSGRGASSIPISQVWRNNLPLSNTPPTAPTGLTAAISGPYVALNWNPASDAETPSSALTYNVRIGTAPGASDVMAPMSFADGRRRLPQAGTQPGLVMPFLLQPGQTYYCSVQAVDSAFAGSPFSAERDFTVSTFFAFTDGTPVFGDTNGDRVVDQTELNTVLNNYWQTSPPNIESVVSPSNTVFQFGLNNLSSLNFHVLASTNMAEPLVNWMDIGPAKLHYDFSDPDATNYPARFYQLVWP